MRAIRKHYTVFTKGDRKPIEVEVLSSVLIRDAQIISFGPWVTVKETSLDVRHSHSTYAAMLRGKLDVGMTVLIRIQNAKMDFGGGYIRIVWNAEIHGDAK